MVVTQRVHSGMHGEHGRFPAVTETLPGFLFQAFPCFPCYGFSLSSRIPAFHKSFCTIDSRDLLDALVSHFGEPAFEGFGFGRRNELDDAEEVFSGSTIDFSQAFLRGRSISTRDKTSRLNSLPRPAVALVFSNMPRRRGSR